uniref:DDE-1 domain-containing protein n=1 Tax=Macrostomum lignano TaxID=282301 RepID=A0A1I8FLB8_9PLAT
MSSAQEQEGSKRRSRLDEFLANNSGLVASSRLSPTSCVLPRHALLLLHEPSESELVAHVATCACVGPADSCNVTVYSCSRCHGASTQLDLMRQHMDIYHGLSARRSSVGQPVVIFDGPGAHRLKKAKSHVPACEKLGSACIIKPQLCAGSSGRKYLCDLPCCSHLRKATPCRPSLANSGHQPLACQRENFEAYGLVGCKGRPALSPKQRTPQRPQPFKLLTIRQFRLSSHGRPCIPPAVSLCLGLPTSGSRLKPSGRRADAEDALLSATPAALSAEQRRLQHPASLVIDELAIVGFLQVSLRLLDLSLSGWRMRGPLAMFPEPQQAAVAGVRPPASQRSQKTIAGSHRGEFSRRWCSPEHRQKPYPSHADTHRLAELTGLS